MKIKFFIIYFFILFCYVFAQKNDLHRLAKYYIVEDKVFFLEKASYLFKKKPYMLAEVDKHGNSPIEVHINHLFNNLDLDLDLLKLFVKKHDNRLNYELIVESIICNLADRSCNYLSINSPYIVKALKILDVLLDNGRWMKQIEAIAFLLKISNNYNFLHYIGCSNIVLYKMINELSRIRFNRFDKKYNLKMFNLYKRKRFKVFDKSSNFYKILTNFYFVKLKNCLIQFSILPEL